MIAPKVNGVEYCWSTRDTTPTIIASQPGWYIGYIYDATGCVSIDSIHVLDGSSFPGHSRKDSIRCDGLGIILQPGSPGTREFLWNTGDTSAAILVNQSGYFIRHSTFQGCPLVDSFWVHLQSPPDLLRAKDTFFCEDQVLTLDAASPGFTYLWNTGAQTSQIIVIKEGTYKVSGTDGYCTYEDSTVVHMYLNPELNLPHDTAVCFEELKSILLDAGDWQSYAWYPTGEHSRTINATYPEMYRVVVTDKHQCTGTDTALVEEACPDAIYIPSAFTPNNDQLNDQLFVRGSGILKMEFVIYNRWGQIVFHSNNLSEGWDGIIDGESAPAGVYTYTLKCLTRKSEKPLSLSGTITLLK